MSTQPNSEVIDQDRRQLLGNAAMGLAAASAASLLPAFSSHAAASDAIRPFRINFPEESLVDLRRRVSATKWPARETVNGPIAGRAIRDDAEARAVLGDGVRLAQDRGEAECAAAVHHRDRRARHSFHSCAFEARECAADDRHAWMAGFDHRADEDHRSADQSHRARRQRIGRLPSGDPVAPRLRLFGQADDDGLGSHPHRPRLGGADAAPRIHPLCGAGRRLGQCRHRADGPAAARRIGRHSHQHARDGSGRHRQARLCQCASAVRPLSRREACVRSAQSFLQDTALAMPRRWGTGRRRCTASRIRRSASPPG